MRRNVLHGGENDRPTSFVNAGAVAATDWLAERIGNPAIRIVDARYIIEMDERGRFHEMPGRDSFLESHIPGAVFFDLDDLRDPDQPAHIVDADTFGGIMSRLGMGNDDEVVVYDTDGGVWSARLWWALRLYGHESVRILDGGSGNWVREGLPMEAGESSLEPSRFVAHLQPGLRVEIDDVVSAMSDAAAVIVDGLTRPFHTGTVRLFPHLPAGHIPGAVNVPAPENLDPKTDRLLPIAELIERWTPVVDGAERIITYCGAGMYGAFDLFVLHLLGYEAALYDGSWEEWAATKSGLIGTEPSDVAQGGSG